MDQSKKKEENNQKQLDAINQSKEKYGEILKTVWNKQLEGYKKKTEKVLKSNKNE